MLKDIQITDLNGKNYKKLPNETYYTMDTDDKMIELLEDIREKGIRCRFFWGNTKTGKDWGDTYDMRGTIGRSTGSIKIPLLIYNTRSIGGSAILTGNIIKIVTTKNNQVLYIHPTYHKN